MIEERRKKYEKELHEKYLQLYHNEQCYEELMQMLEEAYQNRPAELRRLDDRREKEPNWYRNRTMLGMTMYPKLFAGGLKGVIEHLPAMGVDMVIDDDNNLQVNVKEVV